MTDYSPHTSTYFCSQYFFGYTTNYKINVITAAGLPVPQTAQKKAAQTSAMHHRSNRLLRQNTGENTTENTGDDTISAAAAPKQTAGCRPDTARQPSVCRTSTEKRRQNTIRRRKTAITENQYSPQQQSCRTYQI
jgi:hypothetical protein